MAAQASTRTTQLGTNAIRDLIPYELGGTVDLTLASEGSGAARLG